ncbi:membrane-bound (NiFe)-hydrogenase (Ehf-type, Group 4f), small subunit F [Candidatus Sulfopaludibacter sp. SbA6]|nr:membrane-bound (NiFe)-hydrogenase (Ehf-type, Group 4f), small subunit F [Candidatus Sulfopaludibacter sp. SbA6]
MFKILEKTLKAGIVTTPYPNGEAKISAHGRGMPEFDLRNWADARPAADACPSGAIAVSDSGNSRRVTIDYGRCILCGECAAADPTVRMTQKFDSAAAHREDLVSIAEYTLNSRGTHERLDAIQQAGRKLHLEIHRVLGRSLAIREVDAGSCNGCELEIIALNNPLYDIERFGIHFVASPRHADMLLVTGPVTRNMEMALRKTYDATPDPKVVVAVGACGISGGLFGTNYATCGGVDRVLPVDVYIPGCPPRPEALLHGILMALGRLP